MMNLRLINSFLFFSVICLPLTASAACPPGGSAEIISKVNTIVIETPYAFPFSKKSCNWVNEGTISSQKFGQVEKWEEKTSQAIDEINELPQCQPAGQLERECVDHEALSAFVVASGCAITWEYTVCAYSPFEQGILNDKSLGIKKKPATRQRGPRSRRGR